MRRSTARLQRERGSLRPRRPRQNVAGKNQRVRCGAVLPAVARPSSRSARERAWRGVVSEGGRELAPCDAEGDNRADYCAGLGKARGANERGAAAERRVIFRLSDGGGLGPAGRGGHSGAGSTYFGGWGNPQGGTNNNRNTSSSFPKVGFDEACTNRGERPPRVHLHLHLDRI